MLILTSALRWAILGLGIAFFLFVLEGGGMLSYWTMGHPKRQRLCRYAALLILLVTIGLGVFWWFNPTVDNTTSQLDSIQNTLREISDTLKQMQEQGAIK